MFLLVVNVSEMSLQVAGDGKTSGAQVTGVRLLPSMGSKQDSEVI
jgi:hypothetical protein